MQRSLVDRRRVLQALSPQFDASHILRKVLWFPEELGKQALIRIDVTFEQDMIMEKRQSVALY